MSTISTFVTHQVVLGAGSYGTVLSIAATGSVETVDRAGAPVAAILGGAGLGTVTIDNAGTVIGSYGNGTEFGGDGISLASYGAITNSGVLSGGHSYYGFGGDGISLAAGGTVSNSGTIAGGSGKYPAGVPRGAGVVLGAAGSVSNTGLIAGGNVGLGGYGNGSEGVVLAAGGTITNAGRIRGGSGTGNGNGGVGVSLTGGTLTNLGSIAGGNSRTRAGYSVGHGGAGVTAFAGATVINSGTITAGYTDTSGAPTGLAAAIDFTAAGSLENTGVLLGGAVFAAGGSITNSGVIDGHAPGGNNAGLQFSGGGTITNTGTITARGQDAGVVLNGGTLIAKAGLIGGGAQGQAVRFGAAAGTLTVCPGAAFHGAIAANPAAADVLQLSGTAPGTLSGFTGFSAITENTGAHWVLSGSIAGAGTLTVGSHAALQIAGAASIATIAFAAGGGGALTLAAPTQVSSAFQGFGPGDSITLDGIAARALAYQHGTLTLFGAGHQPVDTLLFQGNYTAADFALVSVQGGTEIVYHAAPHHVW